MLLVCRNLAAGTAAKPRGNPERNHFKKKFVDTNTFQTQWTRNPLEKTDQSIIDTNLLSPTKQRIQILVTEIINPY